MITYDKLESMRLWDLESKIIYAQEKIQDWYLHHNGNVVVNFSGGKDSTVLLDIVRNIYPKVRGCFVDTGLEWPEIRSFVKTKENIDWIKPEKSFKNVIEEYGYPIISKKIAGMIEIIRNNPDSNSAVLYKTGINSEGKESKAWKLPKKWEYLLEAPFKISSKCCYFLKEQPFIKYQKEKNVAPYIGISAFDSDRRKRSYLKTGCNSYSTNKSQPLSIFTEDDIWEYINNYKIDYCKIYNDGIDRTGCIFCLFGYQFNSAFKQLERKEPKIYNYCINNLKMGEVIKYIDHGQKGIY